MSRAEAELAAVVLAVGAPPELRDAVASLLAQTEPVEIAVVNSGGGDPHALLADVADRIEIVSVPELLWPGAARNAGIRATRAPWVAFLASDLIAKPDWAEKRLELHRQGRRSVSSAVVNSHPDNLFAVASHLSTYVRRLPGIPKKKARRYGASYDRKLFEQYGGFREDLRIGEDTEFHARIRRPDRPVWAPTVQAVHRSPTTFRDMARDQYERGKRAALHWPAEDDRKPIGHALERIRDTIALSHRATRGRDRLMAIASWPLTIVCAVAYQRGLAAGRRQRALSGAPVQLPIVIVAILDRDNWDANTDVIVLVDPVHKHLLWIPRDLWAPPIGDRINAAFKKGGAEFLLETLKEMRIRAGGAVCLRRKATEDALADVIVTVSVPEPLDFWYPLHPTRPIEEGRKQISFRPPSETLSGERLHQWIGARTSVDRTGTDLTRIERQQVLVRALLDDGADFGRVLGDPELVRFAGADPLPTLRTVRTDWHFKTYGPLKDATIDGKAVLLLKK